MEYSVMLFILRTCILRHMASELNLNMRNDGYVNVQDLLKLNLKTFANVPLRSHSVDDVKEVSCVKPCAPLLCCLCFLYRLMKSLICFFFGLQKVFKLI